jgi:hypothetical protein
MEKKLYARGDALMKKAKFKSQRIHSSEPDLMYSLTSLSTILWSSSPLASGICLVNSLSRKLGFCCHQ